MSLRTRAVAVLSAAVTIFAGTILWWAWGPLPEELHEQWVGELEREARLAADVAGAEPPSESLADRLGEVVRHRVTLIGPDGRARGDSELSPDRLRALEDLSGRPEVQAALGGDVGSDLRSSDAVARKLLYVAVPHGDGALRVAMPAAQLDRPAVQLRRVTVVTAAILLLLLLLAASPLERFLTVPVRHVRAALIELRRGRLGTRLGSSGDDEVARLARSADRLADRLQEMDEGLRERRELEEIFQEIEEGLAVVDDAGRVTRINQAFLDLLGREAAEGDHFGTLFRSPVPRELLQDGLAGQSASHETEIHDRYVLLSVRPHGEGAVFTARDLTRVRRLEGVRRDFVANVSHELKTPLTSVLGFAEALVDSDVPREKVQDFGRRILENGARMRQMIDELMDLSRVESGAWEPEPEEVSLADAIRAAWHAAAGGRAQELELALEVPEGLMTVWADRDGLRSALRNLLSNAARYSPEGGTVTVAAERGDGEVRFEVRDRGPGIPTAHRDRIFERFYRVDEGRSREEGGTGLGLAIVKHLAEAHGGEVGVESRVGEGTTVWFSLPTPAD